MNTTFTLKQIGFYFVAFFLYLPAAFATAESATCHYELYTPQHFERPVVTKSFELDLTKTEFTSTSDPSIKRVIRLQTQPATLDGKTYTHYGFSLTYDGAHTGAIVPKTSGLHIVQVGRDGSDLIGAYLFCEVKITSAPAQEISNVPDYLKVLCANLNDRHKEREILITPKSGRRYTAELSYQDTQGKLATRSLGDLELYLFNKENLTFAGAGVVVETGVLVSQGPAHPARVSSNNPYYVSTKWVCKAY